MGVELPAEDVPILQKRLIAAANRLGIPVITATQMLDSMVKSPRPTRAEISDVANAILDGTDAVMLSNETAMGEYPVEAVKMMATIAARIDNQPQLRQPPVAESMAVHSIPNAISQAVGQVAAQLKAKAIITQTKTGQRRGMSLNSVRKFRF